MFTVKKRKVRKLSNYYISDTHFGHTNSIRFDAQNGGEGFSSIEERDKLIIDNINKVVTPQDNLYFLGDVSWYSPYQTYELLSQINCKNRFLLIGNHDRWAKDGKCKKLFQGIYDIKQITDGNKQVVMSHFPQMMWTGQHRGVVHLYGHVHNTPEEYDYQYFLRTLDKRIAIRDKDRYRPLHAYNTGAMLPYMNYTPRTLDEIISKKFEKPIDNK